MGSLYSDIPSWLHRVPAGLKLALLVLLGLVLFWVKDPLILGIIAGLALALWLSLGRATRPARRLMFSVLVAAGLVALFQLWMGRPDLAWSATVRLACTCSLGAVLTVTTRPAALLDVLEWLLQPLRLVGLSPERLALQLGLMLRFIEHFFVQWTKLVDAWRLRTGRPGGWRLIPIVYAILLIVVGVLQWFITPFPDRTPGASARISEMLTPLKDIRVWRFSLYYVIVFGAYVAYSAILPTYYQDVFRVDLGTAALLTTTFIFPASLLRPLGGWVSDRWGARTAMYATFVPIGALFTVLCIPSGVDEQGNAYGLPLWLVVTLVFLIGCTMGIGKAGVYKHIPTYFPHHVGSVGGLVGMLGGLGGFFLPPMFAYIEKFTGLASTPFIVLTVLTGLTLIWMHLVISRMKRMNPELDLVEVPDGALPV